MITIDLDRKTRFGDPGYLLGWTLYYPKKVLWSIYTIIMELEFEFCNFKKYLYELK